MIALALFAIPLLGGILGLLGRISRQQREIIESLRAIDAKLSPRTYGDMELSRTAGEPSKPTKGPSTLTLMGMLLVISILVILVWFGLPLYTNSIIKKKEAALKQDLLLMHEAINQYYADKDRYPATLETLAEEKYLRSIPEDPFTGSTDTWQTVPSKPAPTS